MFPDCSAIARLGYSRKADPSDPNKNGRWYVATLYTCVKAHRHTRDFNKKILWQRRFSSDMESFTPDFRIQRQTEQHSRFALRHLYIVFKCQDSGYLRHVTVSTWLPRLLSLLRAPTIKLYFTGIFIQAFCYHLPKFVARFINLYLFKKKNATLSALFDDILNYSFLMPTMSRYPNNDSNSADTADYSIVTRSSLRMHKSRTELLLPQTCVRILSTLAVVLYHSSRLPQFISV